LFLCKSFLCSCDFFLLVVKKKLTVRIILDNDCSSTTASHTGEHDETTKRINFS